MKIKAEHLENSDCRLAYSFIQYASHRSACTMKLSKDGMAHCSCGFADEFVLAMNVLKNYSIEADEEIQDERAVGNQ